MLGSKPEIVSYPFEAKDREKVTHPAMIDGEEHPLPKNAKVEIDGFRARLVQHRTHEGGSYIYVPLEYEGEYTRPGGPKYIVEHW